MPGHITDESMTSSDEDDLSNPGSDSGQDGDDDGDYHGDDSDVEADCDDSVDTRGDWGVHSVHRDHVLRRLYSLFYG
jgi:hypothetical protein